MTGLTQGGELPRGSLAALNGLVKITRWREPAVGENGEPAAGSPFSEENR